MNSESEFSLAWWNTGLSPRRGSKPASVAARREVVATVIRDFFLTGEFHGFALGEVTTGDVEFVQERLGQGFRSFVDLEEQTGLAFIYVDQAMEVADYDLLDDRYGDKSLKRGWRLTLVLEDTGLIIQLYICHWPSRMIAQAVREREQLGAALAGRIAETRVQWGAVPTIVMGDFNDEPFDESMSSKLLGSRDRQLVRKREALLYNPFWRKLGERQDIQSVGSAILPAGTYQYKGDQLTGWLTLDQALVSQEFLGGGLWTINEADVDTLLHPEIVSSAGRMKNGFDHLPIRLALSKLKA